MRKARPTTPFGDHAADLDEARGFTSDEGDEYDLTDGFVGSDTDSDEGDEYDLTDGFVVPDSYIDSGSSSDEKSPSEEVGSPYFMYDPQANVDDQEDTKEEQRLLRQQRLKGTKPTLVQHPSMYVEYESGIRSEGEGDEDEDEDEDEDSGVDSQDENFINDHNAEILYSGYR
jgi:hypothetical protein